MVYKIAHFSSYMEVGTALSLGFAVVEQFGERIKQSSKKKIADAIETIEASDGRKQVITDEVEDIKITAVSKVDDLVSSGRKWAIAATILLAAQLIYIGFKPIVEYRSFFIVFLIILPSLVTPITMYWVMNYMNRRISEIYHKIEDDNYVIARMDTIDKKASTIDLENGVDADTV